MSNLRERLAAQRDRDIIVAELGTAFSLGYGDKYRYEAGERQEAIAKLTLEVLLDIRDRLAEMRVWLPSRD